MSETATQWMCELCFPDAVEIGLVAPGLSLILHEGKYRLLWGQGHKGDVFLTFDNPPWPDPDPEVKPNLSKEDDALAMQWLDAADAELEEKLRTHASAGYTLVQTCKESGYGTTGHKLLNHWLYNKCGRLIADAR